MKLAALGSGEHRLETIIGYVLLVGVLVSLILELAGITLYYQSHGSFGLLTQDKSLFLEGRNFFTFLYSVPDRTKTEALSTFLMTLGATVLILTPYTMVITAFFYFAWLRRVKYILITSLILAVISTSLALH
jgi:uncharacterized membrane protein